MAAKIYPGEREKTCACGGTFTGKSAFDGVEFPVCGTCAKSPESYRIRAYVVDERGKRRYHDIRCGRDNKRFSRTIDVLYTLAAIVDEIKAGKFDANNYGHKKLREASMFRRFAAEYLEFNQKRLERGEITPYGMAGKKKYVKVLLTFFGDMPLADITPDRILIFKNSFTTKLTTRNLALTELKTILRHAVLMRKIPYVPEFGRVEGTGTREEVKPISEVRAIIPHIENPTYRMMALLMAECALRPSEVRALQWRDVSLASDSIAVCRHFSLHKLVEGRKSNKKGRNSRLIHAIPAEFATWFRQQPTPMDLTSFVFSNRGGTSPIEEKTLNQAWARTLQKLGIPHFQMYEMRHARVSEVAQETGSMIDARNFAGHSSVITTERRYERAEVDNRKLRKRG